MDAKYDVTKSSQILKLTQQKVIFVQCSLVFRLWFYMFLLLEHYFTINDVTAEKAVRWPPLTSMGGYLGRLHQVQEPTTKF